MFACSLIKRTTMPLHNAIKLFEEKKVRAIWDDKDEKWNLSIVDVVAALTDSVNATAYCES